MKALAAGLLAQGAALDNAPVLLVEIAAWGGATVGWANSDASVTYGGTTYNPRPCSVGAVAQSLEGGAPRLTLSVANHDLAVSALVAAADPAGCAVTVRRAYLDALAAAETLATGLVVSGVRLTEEAATFALAPGDNGARKKVPGRLVTRAEFPFVLPRVGG